MCSSGTTCELPRLCQRITPGKRPCRREVFLLYMNRCCTNCAKQSAHLFGSTNPRAGSGITPGSRATLKVAHLPCRSHWSSPARAENPSLVFVWLWFRARNTFMSLPIYRGSVQLFRVGQFDIESTGHTEAIFYNGMIEPPSTNSFGRQDDARLEKPCATERSILPCNA
jgi:hypothetical protein